MARTAAHADLHWAVTGKRASADAYQLVAGGTSPTMVEAVACELAATQQLLSHGFRRNDSERLAPVADLSLAAQPDPSSSRRAGAREASNSR